jgi:MinD superfamily P-loop ATPase
VKITIASGKGGTGKTTVAVNLAALASSEMENIAYVDCDVEEPDGHLFLHPQIAGENEARVPVPVVDENRCTHCGDCARACRYNALLATKKKVLIFEELCHGCGACSIVCPDKAISERSRTIGVIRHGTTRGGMTYLGGVLNVGEHMATPLVARVKDDITGDISLAVIDASPGTSCPVIEAVRDTDYVILVTEPTPFGLSDLTLAVEMTRKLGVPFGVVINRAMDTPGVVDEYLKQEEIEVLSRIPLDRSIAETISRGEILVDENHEMRYVFHSLFTSIVSKLKIPHTSQEQKGR